jgi:hypothetical protein
MTQLDARNGANSALVESTKGLPRLAGADLIGSAYDPFLQYADVGSTTFSLFDWSKVAAKTIELEGVVYEYPSILEVHPDSSYRYSSSFGQSVAAFQSELATSVSIEGSYNFFNGSLQAEFDEQSLTRSESSFSRVQQTITFCTIRLAREGLPHPLRYYCKDAFLQYLDGLDGDDDFDEFFNTYGSHFLTGVVMGGLAGISSSTNKLVVDRTYELSVVATAQYEGLTAQLSAEDRSKYSTAMSSFHSNSNTRKRIAGGDAIKAADAFDGKEGFKAWTESLGAAPAFVDFTEKAPLTPLWFLCDSQTPQADALELYFTNTWAPNESTAGQYIPEYIDALAVVIGDSNVEPPAGYQKIAFDLNRGAGGDYIYLCYHKVAPGTDRRCLKDLRVIFGKNADPPDGYVKIPHDLNAGAGGQYVYLCYKTAEYRARRAITDVTVVGGPRADLDPPYDFALVPGDLNAGAGGDYVYVCYRVEGAR